MTPKPTWAPRPAPVQTASDKAKQLACGKGDLALQRVAQILLKRLAVQALGIGMRNQ